MGGGDEDVGKDDGGVGVDCGDDDGPDGVPAPPEARGREPPPSPYSLAFSLGGRRVSPLVHGLHGVGGARAPPRFDLSLCLSLFLRFRFWPFTVSYILYTRNSDWAEILTRFLSGYWLSCGERRAPTALLSVHEGPVLHRVHGHEHKGSRSTPTSSMPNLSFVSRL